MQKGKIRDTPERCLSGHFAIRIHSPVENCCQRPLNCHPERVLHWSSSVYLPRSCVSRDLLTVFFFQLLDVPARPLHAGLQQRQRLKHLDKFSESEAGVLVATDVAARGLDIQDVRAVRSRANHRRLFASHPLVHRLFTTMCRRAWTRTCTAAAAPQGPQRTECRCVL